MRLKRDNAVMFDLDEKFTEMKEDELRSIDGGSVSVVCEQTHTITEEEYAQRQLDILRILKLVAKLVSRNLRLRNL